MQTISGAELKRMILSAAASIEIHKQDLNELNVFPVPDGDTGTNMSMTIHAAANDLRGVDGSELYAVAKTAASATLRGARGNSGVILSLLFKGLKRALKGHDSCDGILWAQALQEGVDAAYKAVMKPAEGTILTVSRLAAAKAAAAAQEKNDVEFVQMAALEEAKIALADTVNQNPVLKKAGVVDAGGKGWLTALEAMLSSIQGEDVVAEAAGEAAAVKEAADFSDFNTEDITFTYCTEFIVNRDPECEKEPHELRAYLESIGDCVVVVDDEEIIKVHVHTDHPGNAIENGLTFGQLVHLKIENMRDQHERAKHDAENARKKPPKSADLTETFEPVEPTKPVGFVSVCAGDGIADLFRDLGVDTIVSGGQTMNPSTDDILKAIEATPAETVYVLPNNKNIIMAAEQAIPISTRKVIVIHTRTIPQGITAMLSYDPETDDEANAIEMQKATERVATGQITFAARDSDFDGHKIKQGELLCMIGGKIAFTDTELDRSVMRLLKQMIKRDSAFLTVMYGEDVTDEQAAALEEEIRNKYGAKTEITFIKGGQPVYYYIISVE